MKFKYKLTAMTSIKDERYHLNEWLAYCKLAGIDKVFLYDNGSEDGFTEEIAHFLDIGFVEIIPVPFYLYNNAPGLWALKDHLERAKHHSEWTWMASIDEYIVTKEKPLRDLLDDYKQYAGVCMNWKLFDHNGHETRVPGLVIERFTRWFKDTNLHVKSIVQPAKISGFGDPHYFHPIPGYECVLEDGTVQRGPFASKYVADKIVTNHYFMMSKEEYIRKMSKGRSDIAGHENKMRIGWEEQFRGAELATKQECTDIFPWIEKINNYLNQLKR